MLGARTLRRNQAKSLLKYLRAYSCAVQNDQRLRFLVLVFGLSLSRPSSTSSSAF